RAALLRPAGVAARRRTASPHRLRHARPKPGARPAGRLPAWPPTTLNSAVLSSLRVHFSGTFDVSQRIQHSVLKAAATFRRRPLPSRFHLKAMGVLNARTDRKTDRTAQTP